MPISSFLHPPGSAQLEKAYKKLCMSQQRELRRAGLRPWPSCLGFPALESLTAATVACAHLCYIRLQRPCGDPDSIPLTGRHLAAVSSADEGSAAPIEEVPPEVLEHVLALLPPRDLSSAMCVGR